MAREFWFDSVHDSMFGLRDAILADGDVVSPRGQRTYELRNTVTRISNPSDNLLHGTGRNMNDGLAAIEALQLIGGFSNPQLMEKIAPNTARFQDGGYFHGAYGPRLRGQMPKVIERLRADKSTRQAIAMIWDPAQDLHTDGMSDYPCTIYISWVIRGGKLEQTTHMRSNDLWWGWTYDAVQFTMLHNTVALFLGIPTGDYVHVVDSLHIYDRDLDAVSAITPRSSAEASERLDGLYVPTDDWREVQNLANDIAHHPHLYPLADSSLAADWLASAIMAKTGKEPF